MIYPGFLQPGAGLGDEELLSLGLSGKWASSPDIDPGKVWDSISRISTFLSGDRTTVWPSNLRTTIWSAKMAIETIPAHVGEKYIYSFNYEPYLADGDTVGLILSIEQASKSESGSPDLVITNLAITAEGYASAEIEVGDATIVGTEYVVKSIVNTTLGEDIVATGKLSIVSDSC